MQQDMPLGYRFCPTDDELVGHYLRHKLMADDPSIHETIPEIDVCNFEPGELPAVVSSFSLNKSGEPEWYFFSPRDYKYPNSNRCNRATSSGYWKVTGQDRKIRDLATNNVIGTKKSLVFYQGRTKSNWIIHEYDLFPPNQGIYVVCKLTRKSEKKPKEKTDEMVHGTRKANASIAAGYENQANDMIPGVQIPDSGDFGGSQYEVGSSNEMLRDESEDGFDVDSFLLSSPLEDKQD
ncbi:protein NTM1-like 9 [Neltuma alba]|uniref:protein NTM1-like 9 n=1 Tax=Neltuma alba TaxID=207710 RepID=UPI0010A3CBD3|nr:protein NTM1-like 9 [Prosopis alba]